MTEQTAIEKTNGKELAHFGGRETVRELATRLQATMPGGKKLSAIEATSLAQLAVAHGLDPFNGEAWIIPGSGLMVGIKGLRKKARNQARDEGGTFWTEIRRVEPETYHANKNAIVYECHLRDTVTVGAWAKSINLMTSANVPYKDAIAALGPAPVYVGVGIATPDERSKMEIHARARKRAEADAIKQRYDVEFGQAAFSADEPDAIEGEYSPVETEPREEGEILAELWI